MRLDRKVQVTLKFGPGKQDKICIEAVKAEIRWDENSFMIRGLLKENCIKVEKENEST